MSTSGPSHPSADAWVAAVHASEHDFEPLGTAIVIDPNRVLTCAHVVMSRGAVHRELWVAFPRGDDCPRRRVAAWAIAYSPPVQDLAVLILQEPVPTGVEAAPLRCPKGNDLEGRAWWAFGFSKRNPVGNSAEGRVGASLGYGWVRLDTNSRYLVEPGFSGSGLWSHDYEAVVGIVGEAHNNGDGRAVTLHQADLYLPDQMLAALANWSAETAGEGALREWGWTLARDLEGVRHWRPRARGVSVQSEPGYLFRGRTAALRQIVQWLERAVPDRRVLVVTGSPGAGKSAVLGRIVTTSDIALRASLPSTDTAVRASPRSVHCAVHAKGKTALEIAREIARAASARVPEVADDLAPAVQSALAEREGEHFNIVLDALDEAASAEQARDIIGRVVLPLVDTCSGAGVQIVVGTRRRDDGGELLSPFGGALVTVDLDDPRYFAEADLAAYAHACLQPAGDERPGNPYADVAVAGPLADRIAAISRRNFLVAGLLARFHGLHDKEAIDLDELGFTATVDSALTTYLARLTPVAELSAGQALTTLAFAEAPGWSTRLWQLAAEAIYGIRVDAEELAQFARSAAANFLIEAAEEGEVGEASELWTYRLFHQALNDALLRMRSGVAARTADQLAITLAFIRYGQMTGWENAPPYLLRSLPQHAVAARLMDNLLDDNAYLLHADLGRLAQVADNAISAQGRLRARLVQLTPQAIFAGPAERAALFSVTEALDKLGSSYRDYRQATPYTAQWAEARSHGERAVLEGHGGSIHAVCPVTVADRELLAAACSDGKVRIWDLGTGEEHAVLDVPHTRYTGGLATMSAYGICQVTVAGRQVLATYRSGRIQTWDPDTGDLITTLSDQGWGDIVCSITLAGRAALATAEFGRIGIWDLTSGKNHAVLGRRRGWIYTMCPVAVGNRQLLASSDRYGKVRIWDADTEKRLTVIRLGRRRGKVAVCPVTMGGRQLLATADRYGKIGIWDPDTGKQHGALSIGRSQCDTICGVTVAGRPALASGGLDGTVRIWDLGTGKQYASLTGHGSWVRSICPVTAAGRELLATASDDGTVRIWSLDAEGENAVPEEGDSGVHMVCPVTVAGHDLLATAEDDGRVRLWDPGTGQQQGELDAEIGMICPVTVAARSMLAASGEAGAVSLWDLDTGEQFATPIRHGESVIAMCEVTASGLELLATGGVDGRIRLWDLRTGEQHSTLARHREDVGAMCPVTVTGLKLLATADDDGRVRLWDPGNGEQYGELDADEDWVSAMCPVTLADRPALATAVLDGTVRILDLGTGEELGALTGHQDTVSAMCTVTIADRVLLVTAGGDRTIRVWDPGTGVCLVTVPTHYAATAVTWIGNSLAIGLDAGVLVIKVNGPTVIGARAQQAVAAHLVPNASPPAKSLSEMAKPPFALASDEEEQRINVRLHPAVLIRPTAVVLGALIIAVTLSDTVLWYDSIGLVIVWVVWGVLSIWSAWKVVVWYQERFIATSTRMMLVSGVLRRRVVMKPFANLTDLSFQKSLPGRILGYGDLIIESAGQEALEKIGYIPYPEQIYLELCHIIFPDADDVSDG
jgi:WD40 repeat protein